MKQVFQSLKDGSLSIVESPDPIVSEGHILISTKTSLISSGTERMLLDFGKSSYLEKARKQPEKVKAVLNKARTDGLIPTISAVKDKLDDPLPLGYCNFGTVVEVGSKVKDYKVGDRVASNGPHADLVHMPINLCAKVPEEVEDDQAPFAVAGSIGLQGIRLANPTLGESFAVIGTGLIGLLTIELLIANGCRVLAIDYDKQRLKIAKDSGAEVCDLSEKHDPVEIAMEFSQGNGLDGVIICASTDSNDTISQAASMSRKRGRIILVGVTGLNINREDFYEKELSFQVSCSYGPGRYDSSYELSGNDYPFPYVRWTEQRNFQAVLNMIAQNKINVSKLISQRIAFDNVASAYEELLDSSSLGIILQYENTSKALTRKLKSQENNTIIQTNQSVIGFIGSGNYAKRTLIPAFRKAGANLHTLVSQGGASAAMTAKKEGFLFSATDPSEVFTDDQINTIVIATRHDSHADLVLEALNAGKHVFVEKPLSINLSDLEKIEQRLENTSSQVMVGFNRRFSPLTKKVKELLDRIKTPKSILITVNAGYIPQDHWTQHPELGGGRIIGEACHFIDLMRHLIGHEISFLDASGLGDTARNNGDNASIIVNFKDGSLGTIMYLSDGSNKFPKERVEVFSSGGILQLDNFKSLRGYDWPGFRKMSLMKQDKGQIAAVKDFLDSIESGIASIDIKEILEVSYATLRANEKIKGN